MNLVPQLYSIDLSTFRVAMLSPKVLELCYGDSVEVVRRVTLATPYGNPEGLPLSNPTKCRKLGLQPVELNTRGVEPSAVSQTVPLVYVGPFASDLLSIMPHSYA
jgi:hypothetical protein